ncbi:MAG: DUF3179 domain-containing protein [Candidatus Pacebacteria bacterium]|jgi:hypothetical protein|nr:hypothetical protein [bacterium]MDP6527379.1 DUF3179 domain-containing protein [Candidatus Paceibacterota bacterium]MDP6659506.1 DUF3179 domain-containing protein [Candidatus Paceibacterota bacterium]|tara:strand:- start:42902 stop:43963 length:1062 start_codon:yes stop_codon:yes gene_type:complete
MQNTTTVTLILLFIVAAGFFFLTRGDKFELPEGETTSLEEKEEKKENVDIMKEVESSGDKTARVSEREVFVTDGVRHSIPLNEILSGGPPKDGIPSIYEPKFISIKEARDFLDDNSPGLGVKIGEVSRFYPYQILVWHELVNDTLNGEDILVSYCPLCLTGVVFDRRVDSKAVEFGVSGKLWKSNLLMYDRTGDSETESLWSQVLGEGVLGPETGTKLKIIPSDAVRFSDWIKENPNTEVLSKDTGATRIYGGDPYGDYYTNDTVSFGASFSDTRLHQKEFVLGIEVAGEFKAYHTDALKEGITIDSFRGETIEIVKDKFGGVRMSIDGEDLPYIGGFWFSWLAVHPDTELFK